METTKTPLMTRRLLLFMGTMILANISGQMFMPLLPLYVQELGADIGQVGLFFIIGAIAPLAFQIFGGWLSDAIVTMVLLTPSGWLSDRKGERLGIVLGFGLIAAAMAVFLNSKAFIGFAVVWALFGFGSALIEPAYNSLISKVVPMKLRGTAFGLFSTSIGLISLPAPYIGAMLWERYTPRLPFYFPLIATLLVLPVMWIKFQPKEEELLGVDERA